jgi:hypothetical protein
MKLNAPKNVTYIICLVLGLIGIIGHFAKIPFVSTYAFPILAIAFVVLAAANYFKGL